ncbi:CoA-transferase [Chloroflexota bacterium]
MKGRLTDELIAMRAVKELEDGDYVNLGLGIPSLLSSYIPEGKTIYFHSESGVICFGRALTADEKDKWDYNLVNATSPHSNYLASLEKEKGQSIFSLDTGLPSPTNSKLRSR